jgi:anti-sigma factor RsiW
MRCREAEKWLLRSLDGALPSDRQSALDKHLEECPDCRKAQREYLSVQGILRGGPPVEPLPFFWTRFESRLREQEKLEQPWTVWLKWSRRAIPVAVLLIGFFVGAIAFQPSPADEEMSQPAALLLQNANPLAEANTFFNEKSEDKNMMIIFAGDERLPGRRYLP